MQKHQKINRKTQPKGLLFNSLLQKHPLQKALIMKNTTLLFIFIILSLSINAQDKMLTKTGKITFEASIPSFEEVKATNETASCVLHLKTGKIASLALVKGFRFKAALMEEHFNETYIESNTYPKATFKGKIEDFNWKNISSNPKEYKLKGKLELHGKSKDITTTVILRKVDGGLEIHSDFNVNSDDFDIVIPKPVSNKISKIINIKIDFKVE